MPSDLPLSAEAEARKWRAYAAAAESAHAVVALALGFRPPNVSLSIDPATPGYTGMGRDKAAGWRHFATMWFEAAYARTPSIENRLNCIDARVMVAVAGSVAHGIDGSFVPPDRESIAPEYFGPYPEETGYADDPESTALLLLTEKLGLLGRPYGYYPDAADEVEADAAWNEALTDEFLIMAQRTHALLTDPVLLAFHAQIAGELCAASTLPFERVLEIMLPWRREDYNPFTTRMPVLQQYEASKVLTTPDLLALADSLLSRMGTARDYMYHARESLPAHGPHSRAYMHRFAADSARAGFSLQRVFDELRRRENGGKPSGLPDFLFDYGDELAAGGVPGDFETEDESGA